MVEEDYSVTEVCEIGRHIWGMHLDKGEDYCDYCGVYRSDYV